MTIQTSVQIALVVEDEPMLRFDMARELRRAGWGVLEASSGEQAQTLRETRDIDLIITDIRLDGALSGWDVAETFRALHPTLPVVYVSANAAELSRMVPDSVFLSKPLRIDELLNVCGQLSQAGKRLPD